MKEPTSPKIIVAMPAHNEEKYIGSVVLQAKKYADEIIVIDDGSTDRTAKVAELAGATVIRHGENKGYGAAIQSIMAESQKRAPDILVLIDADSQHNPDEIPSLTKAITEGYDLVIGSREKQKLEIPTYRRFGQRIIALFTGILSKEKIFDTESGFRAFSKKAIDTLELKETGMAISAEAIAKASEHSLKITEAPISITYTKNGSTLNPVKHGVSVLNRVMVMISEKRPLLFFGLFGILLIIGGVVTGVVVVRILYEHQILQLGSALISMLLITVGMLSIFAGIILDVLVRRIGGFR